MADFMDREIQRLTALKQTNPHVTVEEIATLKA
jgi:hypothetical protein